MKTAKEIGKKRAANISQGFPVALVGRLGLVCLVSGLDQLQCKARSFTSYIPALCVFIFVCLLFVFFFYTSHTHHSQLLVLNETPEPRSVEFFLLLLGTFFFFFKEIVIFKFYRVFKRFWGFCFVNMLFYSWGKNQPLGK